jgi:hypothetical protein
VGQDKSGKKIYSSISAFNPIAHFAIQVSSDKVEKAKQWVRNLNFMFTENTELLKDSFRNGIMLCELTQLIGDVQVFDVTYSPKNTKDCEENLSKALLCLLSQFKQELRQYSNTQ